MRVAVAGARGQLGAAIVHEFSGAGHDVIPFSHQALDVTDDGAVEAAVEQARPDAVVNCAAYNEVDAAEDHPVDALNLNAFAVRSLATAAERAGAVFVHYGSDFVFDGTSTSPYREDAAPSPLSSYGASKMLGEWFALDASRAYVLRVESLFGRAPGGGPPKGSVAGILNGLRNGTAPRVFEDRTVSPTYIMDAAHATRRLLESSAPTGLYHCVSSGFCTWLEFGVELARLLGLEPKLTPVRASDVKLKARRPLYCALSNERLRQAGIEMPTWQDALERYVRAIISAPSSAGATPLQPRQSA